MTFVDKHPWREAFIANLLDRLAGKITEQGEDFLVSAGLTFPARAVSSVLLIAEQQHISAADIAKVLDQPHQLVTQRIDLLLKLGIVERMDDPDDGRRKLLKLSLTGRGQFERLESCLTAATKVFANLFEEIDCDLTNITTRAMSALDERSILERANDLQITSKEEGNE